MSNFDFLKSGPIPISPIKSPLIPAILQQPETHFWTPKDYTHTCYYLEIVPKDSVEYIDIQTLFKKKSPGLQLKEVKRVQNPYLLGEFLIKKMEMAKHGPVTINRLFHGTKRQAVKTIIEEGFDWRLHGENRGFRFGKGVNFTPNARFATNFGNHTQRRVMILANVLIGRSCVGSEDMDLPPEGFDTTMRSDGNVVVKFEDNEHYPAYVLTYMYYGK